MDVADVYALYLAGLGGDRPDPVGLFPLDRLITAHIKPVIPEINSLLFLRVSDLRAGS